MIFLLLFSVLLSQQQRPARSRLPEFTVPQGWTVKLAGIDLHVTHATGASLTVIRSRHTEELASYAHKAAEGWANPLGFARIGEPSHFSDASQNGLNTKYKATGLLNADGFSIVRSETLVVWSKFMYENSAARFDTLLTEVHSIVAQFLSK